MPVALRTIGSAHSQGCRVIFWEAHLPQRASRHSFAIECVPLAKRDADVAASYFRKVLVTVLSHCHRNLFVRYARGILWILITLYV